MSHITKEDAIDRVRQLALEAVDANVARATAILESGAVQHRQLPLAPTQRALLPVFAEVVAKWEDREDSNG